MKKETKVYMINEYEEFSDLTISYLRSYLFTAQSDARKFMKKLKKENTIEGGLYRYELEIEILFQDYKTALEVEGLE